MRGVNKVILVGTLGRDPEMRYTADQKAIANLSIATSEQWKDRNTGQQQEKTEWHRVVIFGKLAEIAGQYLKKGSQVYLEGKLQTRKWQDQSGADRYSTEVVLDINGQMQMLGGRATGGSTEYAQQAPAPGGAQGPMQQNQNQGMAPPPPQQQPMQQSAPQDNFADFDDDIPF